eukprot:TRINITY_DN13164_c0_g1_i1.p2 TRINITY_DN13164_c0_g1~~TRINITY_DN13164_c0_g1_i1.p2  ORF type:complete len:101 (-),score=1.88 TRINITY_DN13164_c0_g1_i1:166-468(-)
MARSITTGAGNTLRTSAWRIRISASALANTSTCTELVDQPSTAMHLLVTGGQTGMAAPHMTCGRGGARSRWGPIQLRTRARARPAAHRDILVEVGEPRAA